MTTADHILGQIDDALEDWSVSDDAMRSRPAAGEAGIAPRNGAAPQMWIADEAGEWQELRGVTGIELHIDTAGIDQQWQALRDRIVRLQVERAQLMQAALNEAMAALTEAVKPAAEAANRGLAEIAKALQRSGRDIAGGGQGNFRHLPEAVGCNDCRTPAPRRDRPAWKSPYGPAQRRR